MTSTGTSDLGSKPISETNVHVNIKQHMKSIIQNYELLRGQSKNDNAADVWDAIIITTADEDQSKAYRYQLDKKLERKEIMQNVPFYVFADPPGPKIGSGGSVLYSLDRLHSEIGDKMFTMRILFICAGGKSQRLPSASILGKLFLPLPLGEPLFHMLDLQIALHMPFLRHMKPGVLIACSDAIETYYLPVGDSTRDPLWSFQGEGFTALGTISSIEIGKSHGVYVLPKCINTDYQDVIRSTCIQVLQKPSLNIMKETGAILEDGNVCTDSIFFFDHEVTRKFLNYTKCQQHITCEIDAYGDFLQPLGSRASLNYIENTSNVVSAEKTLGSTRKEIYDLLNGTPLHVVFLQQSMFYHLGTMTEYIENITPNAKNCLFDELGCKSVAFSRVFMDSIPSLERTSIGEIDCGLLGNAEKFLEDNPGITVMHSLLDFSVKIGQGSVVEYCYIKAPVSIGGQCIISNCKIVPRDNESRIHLPARSFFHTAAIHFEGNVKFVTVAFGVSDNLKSSAKAGIYWDPCLKFMDVPLGRVCAFFRIKNVFDYDAKSLSLWNAKLFPVADSMEESFLITSNMVNKISELTSDSEKTSRPHQEDFLQRTYSMEEILGSKSVEKMIAFQEDLRERIKSA